MDYVKNIKKRQEYTSIIEGLKMNFSNEIILKLDDLINFIYFSKRKCFAGTDLKVSLSDGSSLYSNRELPWLYTDNYCGNTIERGTEDVYFDMVLVWSMQYRGGILEPFWNIAETITQFLKHALINLPRKFPVRGPSNFLLNEFEHEDKIIKGNFVYYNKWEGDIKEFTGYEKIFWNGDEVFYHNYIGGLVRNKHFRTKVL